MFHPHPNHKLNIPEVPHVVLQHEYDFLGAGDVAVCLATGVEVVDGAAQVLEEECPIPRLHHIVV